MSDSSQEAWRRWWDEEGSGIRPLPNEDAEQFARRMTEIAWSNGAFKRLAEVENLRAELAAECANTASLLHTLALIREAGRWQKEMLSELPSAVKAMRKQRDEAHSLIQKWRLNLVDVVDVGDYMDAMTSEARIRMNDADKRAFLAATRKQGGGA